MEQERLMVTRLIPFDQRYQWQFLTEFEEVSRAVSSRYWLIVR